MFFRTPLCPAGHFTDLGGDRTSPSISPMANDEGGEAMPKPPISRLMGETGHSLGKGVLYLKLACTYFEAATSHRPPVLTLWRSTQAWQDFIAAASATCCEDAFSFVPQMI